MYKNHETIFRLNFFLSFFHVFFSVLWELLTACVKLECTLLVSNCVYNLTKKKRKKKKKPGTGRYLVGMWPHTTNAMRDPRDTAPKTTYRSSNRNRNWRCLYCVGCRLFVLTVSTASFVAVDVLIRGLYGRVIVSHFVDWPRGRLFVVTTWKKRKALLTFCPFFRL